MTKVPASYPDVFEPARLARLARGLSMTLRSLSSNRGCDEWTGVSVSKKLAIQRFYREFDAWAKGLEELALSVDEDEQCCHNPMETSLEPPKVT